MYAIFKRLEFIYRSYQQEAVNKNFTSKNRISYKILPLYLIQW